MPFIAFKVQKYVYKHNKKLHHEINSFLKENSYLYKPADWFSYLQSYYSNYMKIVTKLEEIVEKIREIQKIKTLLQKRFYLIVTVAPSIAFCEHAFL